nr:unnamed protein product [Callosobruchus chinensis]
MELEVNRSNSKEVTLTDVERETSGEFKCEVSADAPLFHTDIRSAKLLVAGIISNRPISVVELECRRLATAASLSKDLEAITAWGLRNMVECNASKTQYCTLSNKKCPSKHSVLMKNQALPRSHSFKLLGAGITENMIWHQHVSSIATAAGKRLGYLFRARKYFSPSNLLTLYKAQIRPSLEYCSHIWGDAAPTTLSIHLMQSREGQFDSSVTRP